MSGGGQLGDIFTPRACRQPAVTLAIRRVPICTALSVTPPPHTHTRASSPHCAPS